MKQPKNFLIAVLSVALVVVYVGPREVVRAASVQIQNVLVTNWPATQKVSGTVTVGNLPATQTVVGTVDLDNANSRRLANIATAMRQLTFDGDGNLKTMGAPPSPLVATKTRVWQPEVPAGQTVFAFGETINLSSIVLRSNSTGKVSFRYNGNTVLVLGGAQATNTSFNIGDEVVSLPAAIPADEVISDCPALAGGCSFFLSIAGT